MSSKNEYTPLPTDEHAQPAPACRDEDKELGWKVRLLPVLGLFAVLAVLGTGIASCKGRMGMGHGTDATGMGMHKHMPGHGHGHGHGNGHMSHGVAAGWSFPDRFMGHPALVGATRKAACPAQPAPRVVGDEWNPAEDAAYAAKAASRLSAAVKIQTVSYDDMPADATDPRFDSHREFAAWMQDTFPSVYEHLQHEVVNTHAHLFTWKGSEGGKPVMLMAHEDVVPVNPDTVGQWTYPPWSGEITTDVDGAPGVWIWGRGSSDCKNSLVGILAATEKLLAEGFTPPRDVLIAYGFDEEIGGARGAMQIAKIVEERYGEDGVAFIIDEGFSGIEDVYGARLAALGMAEKGAVSVAIRVDTPGGHSSVPPEHTGIGLMARLLKKLEDHPFKPELVPEGPYLKYLSCLAEYAPEFPSKLAKKVKNPKTWPKLAKELAKSDRVKNSFLATSTAIDLIRGGVKVNALPETVDATVNHRISFTSSVNVTLQHYVDLLLPLTKKLGLTATFFGQEHGKSERHVTVKIVGNEHKTGLEPAPITPADSEAFAFIGSAIRAVFGHKTVITPTGMFANTDTARCWSLTRHVYRFTPAHMSETLNPHTVDERISLRAHLSTTQFYHRLIRNLECWEADK